jgi:hypothetical protein
VSNHDREKAILAAAQADSDANGDGTVNSVDFDNAERMIRAYEAALAAPVVQDVDERQGFVVVPVPAHVIREGDEVVTASGLGSVRKTVFSIIDGDEEGICLNFTDADALCLPVRDVLVLRVAERQRVSQDAPTDPERWAVSGWQHYLDGLADDSVALEDTEYRDAYFAGFRRGFSVCHRCETSKS